MGKPGHKTNMGFTQISACFKGVVADKLPM
jgi:hypothetical protein